MVRTERTKRQRPCEREADHIGLPAHGSFLSNPIPRRSSTLHTLPLIRRAHQISGTDVSSPTTSNPFLPGTRVNDVPPPTTSQIPKGHRAFPAPLHFSLPRFPPLEILGRIFPDQLKLEQLTDARQPLYTSFSPGQKQRLRFFEAHILRVLPTAARLRRMRNEDESDGD